MKTDKTRNAIISIPYWQFLKLERENETSFRFRSLSDARFRCQILRGEDGILRR